MKINFIFVGIGIFAMGIHAYGAAAATGEDNGKKGATFDVSGFGSMMFGQVVSGHAYSRFGEKRISHAWQDFYKGDIVVTGYLNDWFRTKVGLEVRSSFPIYSPSDDDKLRTMKMETFRLQYRPTLPTAEGIALFNFRNQSSLCVESGIFQYNFNPEIKNLGNYLYRGVAYPLYLETKLDYPWYDMAGIRGEYGFLDNRAKVGVIVNSMINHPPYNDFSLGLTASYTLPNKAVDMGAGICFDRLLSINKDATEAKGLYTQEGYDSSWTLRSTKLDTRFSFDLKPLIGNPDILGLQDAKLYGEMAILGFKDPNYLGDSTFTSTLFHRMPILLGINLPVFKILDLFSIEIEYFDSPYSNDWWGQYGSPSPAPVFSSSSLDSEWRENYKTKDNVKWTVYMKKSFNKFDIVGIFANDHTIYDTYSAVSYSNTEQSLRTSGNWHWYIKLQYNL